MIFIMKQKADWGRAGKMKCGTYMYHKVTFGASLEMHACTETLFTGYYVTHDILLVQGHLGDGSGGHVWRMVCLCIFYLHFSGGHSASVSRLFTFQRWAFSVCFSPIQDWGFSDHEPLGEHLKICPFNQRNTKTEPYRFPMGCDILSEEIIQKLYQSAGLEYTSTGIEASGDGSKAKSTCVEVEKGGELNLPSDQIRQGCSEEERRKSADLNQAMSVDNAALVS
jgi:hypothetical protein